MKQLIEKLQTVKNYALGQNITPSYIYKLVRQGKMDLVEIDGIKFVNVKEYPVIPVINRRK